MTPRHAGLLVASVASACAPAARAPRNLPAIAVASAPRPHAPPTPTHCPETVDVADLLHRHAVTFGDEERVRGTFPYLSERRLTMGGAKGTERLIVDATRFRLEGSIGGLAYGMGQDDAGYWDLGLPGVVLRLQPDEAQQVAARAWVERRSYLSAYVPGRDAARCSEDEGPKVDVRYDLPELGWPLLRFDLATAALEWVRTSWADGSHSDAAYREWSAPDTDGVRRVTVREQGDPIADAVSELARGVPRWAGASSATFVPPPGLEIAWPAAGVARVPMTYANELSLRVRVGGREVWAVLDSGAEMAAVDSGAPAAASLTYAVQSVARGWTQTVDVGIGWLSDVAVGEVRVPKLPAARVPLPVLAKMGARQPEAVLGASLFLGNLVRIDYAKGELGLAKAKASVVGRAAVAVPLQVTDNRIDVQVDLEGHRAWLQLDTGAVDGILLSKDWADHNGLPGDRPSIAVTTMAGLGTAATTERLVRLGPVVLGPIRYPPRLAPIVDSSGAGREAGAIGNALLSSCAAVIFDVPDRTLWLEPPCDLGAPEPLAGWTLTRAAPPQGRSDHPWVIEAVLPAGPAQAMGLEAGDRLLQVGGVPVGLDRSRVDEMSRRREGTKLVVVYERAGKTTRGTMTLAPVLPYPGTTR